MRHGTSEPVKPRDDYGIEVAAVRFGHQAVELRAGVLGPANAGIDVLADGEPAAALAILAQLAELDLGVLPVQRTATCIKRGPSWRVGGQSFPWECWHLIYNANERLPKLPSSEIARR